MWTAGIAGGVSLASHFIIKGPFNQLVSTFMNPDYAETIANGGGIWLLAKNGKREYLASRDMWYDVGFSAAGTLAGIYLEKVFNAI
jgi:hypothetical protein